VTAEPISRNALNALIAIYKDHAAFCSRLTIRNKEGVSVVYRPSPGGRKLSAAIRRQEEAGKPVRLVVLKASQVWMSSSCATEIFKRIPFWGGRRALVIADTQAHADLVFSYYDQYIKSYSLNPIGTGAAAGLLQLPRVEKDTEQNIRWSNGSSILIGTANNIDIGRSAPYNWAQLSEAAFYRSLSALMTGLMQRVPESAESGVIVESTANGEGGDFYDLCQLAMSGKSGWGFCFFAWHEHPENSCKPEDLGYRDSGAFERTLTRDEQSERDQYHLSLDQLAWRRRKIETDCRGHIESFRQEHPANPQEAFQGSGRKIFDVQALSRMPLIEEPARGRLELFPVGMEKKVQFLLSPGGELAIYRQPAKGGRYVIGVDHAEGIDPSARDGHSDPDYCCAQVLDADSGEQCAVWHDRLEPRPWAQAVYYLGVYFNHAFCVPEQKALGKAVIGHLLELTYPIDLIYSAERDPSDRRTALLQELGYDTNTVFRPILISALDTALREMAVSVHDGPTLSELRAFVRKANGREEGIRHDDYVFALALAVVGLGRARKAFTHREQREKTLQAAVWKPIKYGQRPRPVDDD